MFSLFFCVCVVNGDVNHPALRVLVAVFVLLFILLLLPVWLPLHFILRALGRRGFIVQDLNDGRWSVLINADGFRR